MLQDKELRTRLAEEFRYAAKKMQQEGDPARKLYFFSAFYGEAGRILNWAWDRDVLLMFVVLQHTYQQVTVRLQALNPSGPAKLPDGFFGALTQTAVDLANYVSNITDKPEELNNLLGRFAELGYLATGNGSYLYEKGLIKF